MTPTEEESALRIERLVLGPYSTNAFILVCRRTGYSLLVDAPARAGTITERLCGTTPHLILLTHNHGDHTGALEEVRSRLHVPLAAHQADAALLPTPPDIYCKNGDTLTLGDLRVEVIHTPGHTPGSLCFKVGNHLLAGDTLFPEGPGHTATPSALRQVIESITLRLFVLEDETHVHPGHGDQTTIGKAKEEYAVFASRSHPQDLCGDVLWLSS